MPLLSMCAPNQRPRPGLGRSIADLQSYASDVALMLDVEAQDPILRQFEADENERNAIMSKRVDDWLPHYSDLCTRNLRRRGASLGPVQNALYRVDSELRRAMMLGYPMGDAVVREKFCNYLMMLSTDGYEDMDDTGTVMGNYRGEWRGGGFLDM